ncbi:MAG: 3-dehydroquinate synthase [Lachnospiraceae bacterium]|nr:3-dehydroquinate synthase [Lachnospiraceae bacterium]
MKTIDIRTGRPYQVHIGSGIFSRAGEYVRSVLPGAVRAAVITDSNVGPLYLKEAEKALAGAGLEVISMTIKAGEESKNIGSFAEVLSFLAAGHITRSDCVIALGGGVVGDLAGFAAASYLRGIPYVQIPTSLLAMVDSSVGGKTAVDLPEGKNLAGAFHQPAVVVCDPQLLDTLPENVFRDGCAEVIKYGVLDDREMFDHLAEKGMGFDRESVIARCIEIKGDYVSRDELDNGDRMKLNLGHTFGHAIEAASDFTVTHGQAVAAGMCIIARASAGKDICTSLCAGSIEECVRRFRLPAGTGRSAAELAGYVGSDKKRRGDAISLIVPEMIGKCGIIKVPVQDTMEWLRKGLSDECDN